MSTLPSCFNEIFELTDSIELLLEESNWPEVEEKALTRQEKLEDFFQQWNKIEQQAYVVNRLMRLQQTISDQLMKVSKIKTETTKKILTINHQSKANQLYSIVERQ